MLVGRIVDSYTNILTVKLFAHAEREDAYARAALRGADGQVAGVAARADGHGARALFAQRPAIASASGLAIWLWSHDLVTSAPSPW